MNTLFQGVNLNLVPSGILSDYGFSFINLDNFTGQALHDSNRVDLQRWRFLYGALETSKVNSNFALTDLGTIPFVTCFLLSKTQATY